MGIGENAMEGEAAYVAEVHKADESAICRHGGIGRGRFRKAAQ